MIWLSAGCASGPPPLPGSEPGTPKHYVCARAPALIMVDGVTTDDEWRGAPWSDAFVDIQGAKRPLPRFETRMRMMWDDECLYVAAWLSEPDVWATYDQRDLIVFEENDFEIFIDPDGDTRNYYEIEVNALGTIFDLFLRRTYIDGGPADHAWNLPGMRWAVHVEGTLNDARDIDRGWSVEFALPWSAFADQGGMPCPPRAGDQWRINFSRVQWRHEIVDGAYCKTANTKEDNWVWSPQGVIDMHRPQRWGVVRFAAGFTAANAGDGEHTRAENK
jgi:hypothetical protein